MTACKTIKLKAYTTRAGYAQADAVLEDLRLLYNGALRSAGPLTGRPASPSTATTKARS